MGERRNDPIRDANARRIVDVISGVIDFSDTGERLNDLDTLISIDTTAAHLAGATGPPAFILLPHVPDWRGAIRALREALSFRNEP